MELRFIPEITFVHDPSLESGSHMETLFEEMRKKDAGGE
jgi:ribosome-binding factor A